MKTTQSFLTALPAELLLHILSSVGPLDLHNLATVARFFHDFLDPTSTCLWFPLIRRHSPFGVQVLQAARTSTTLTPRDFYFAATLHTQVLIWPTDTELAKDPHLIHDLHSTARSPFFGRAARVRLGQPSTPTKLVATAFGTHILQANGSLTTLGQVSLFAPWCAATGRKHLFGQYDGVRVKQAFTSRTQIVVQDAESGKWMDITQVPTVACGLSQCVRKMEYPATTAAGDDDGEAIKTFDVIGSGSAHVVAYAAATRQLFALRSPLPAILGRVPKEVGQIRFVGSTAHHVVVATKCGVWIVRVSGGGSAVSISASTWEQVLVVDNGDRIVEVSTGDAGILVQIAASGTVWIPVPTTKGHDIASFNDTGWHIARGARQRGQERAVCGASGQVAVIRDGQGYVFGNGTWLPLEMSLGGAGMAVIAVPLLASYRRRGLS
ncbi:hypothetical protein BCR44DRAFT_37395 [Catenaria anguillulae PL171]|uniref:F-box domain-containing protein n=1 Tax=Catenaria anguillulae PL171 TaxID=765915 RepID=A0A1Y2HRU5_9FUNG|nr:hypothetical protein BCR44DRAFT_37395 [Catenaria anguillulae PL171]